MSDGPPSAADVDFAVLRSGVRLMALRAIGDPEAADEVAQETLARAVDVLRHPDRAANLGAYVAGIARHVIADYFRAAQRTVSIDEVAADALHDDRTDALAALCSEGELIRVREALALLSDDDRELMRLCYFEELTPTEIAERLGAPPERIRQRKLRALQRLRLAFDSVASVRHVRAPAPTSIAGMNQVEGLASAP